MPDAKRRLLRSGVLLFLLGLLTGLVEAEFANVRMGLAAHLEGVMNGMLLLILGAVWQELRLGARAEVVAFWALLYGTFANWGFTTFSAMLGTVGLSPITAAGREAATPWQEHLVLAGFISVGLAMLVAIGIVLWGLRGGSTDHPA